MPPKVHADRILTMDQAVLDDPYSLAAVLRRECPVFREPAYNVLVVTRYDDLIDVARRPQDFSSILAAYGPSGGDRGPVPAELCAIAARAGGPDPAPNGRVAELLASYQPDLQDQLQHVDPPLHTRHRRIVNRWFSPRAVAAREDDVRETATLLIDRFAAGGRVEILDALAGPLPATVIADIIGIPDEHRALFLDWKEEVFGNPEAEVSRATSERYLRIREIFLTFIEARRAEPTDDMVSNLVAAQTGGGEGLDDQTVLGLLMLFLGGGQETTGKAITSGLRLLGERPELQRNLRGEPDRLADFIEEVLRFEPPVRGIFRIATRNTEIGGVEVPEGSFVHLMWASGNRDDRGFEDGDVFDPERFAAGRRPARPILTFGHGIHLCPGAPLARLQIRIAFEELLTRFRSIRLADDNPYNYVRSHILRGLAGLWLDLEPV
jgi:cytochrome P450 family 150 subfamily A5